MEHPVNTLCTVPHLLIERRYERGWKSNTKALESWKFSFTTIEVQITQARYEFHLFIALLLSGFPSWNNHNLLFHTDLPRRKPSARQRWMLWDIVCDPRTPRLPWKLRGEGRAALPPHPAQIWDKGNNSILQVNESYSSSHRAACTRQRFQAQVELGKAELIGMPVWGLGLTTDPDMYLG